MSSDSEHYSSGLKVKKFTGKCEEFAIWWSQFCAFCTLKGILEALFKKFDSKLPAKEDDVLNPSDNTEKGSGIEMMNEHKMTAQRVDTLQKNDVEKESGIEIVCENEMTAQWGDGINTNVLPDYKKSGNKMTAKWDSIEMTVKDSGKNEVKVYWVRDSGAELHRPCFSGRENVNSEQGGVLEVEKCARDVTILESCESWESQL